MWIMKKMGGIFVPFSLHFRDIFVNFHGIFVASSWHFRGIFVAFSWDFRAIFVEITDLENALRGPPGAGAGSPLHPEAPGPLALWLLGPPGPDP